MKNMKEAGMNVLNSVKKHKVITVLVFVVALVGAASMFFSHGYFFRNVYFRVLNTKLDFTSETSNVVYYVNNISTNTYVLSSSPTSAYLAGQVTYNSSKSTCSGCTNVTSVSVYGDVLLPPHNDFISSAKLYFETVAGANENPDVIVNLYKKPNTAPCGTSCPSAVPTNASLKDLFNDGWSIDYTSSSCDNNGTFEVNYHNYSIVAKPARTNGATELPETTCNIMFQRDNSILTHVLLTNNPPSSTVPASITNNTAATTDEGLIPFADEYGQAYAFRGRVQDNYVAFGGYQWRVMRINGDGSVRLFYDGEYTDWEHGLNVNWNPIYTTYNPTEYLPVGGARLHAVDTPLKPRNSLAGHPTRMQSSLNNWYQEHLTNYDRFISYDTLFCNNYTPYSNITRTSQSGGLNSIYELTDGGDTNTFYYFGESLATQSNKNLKCQSAIDVFSANGYNPYLTEETRLRYPIGTISYKEWVLAGNKANPLHFSTSGTAPTANTYNYLYNAYTILTSSPQMTRTNQVGPYITSIMIEQGVAQEFKFTDQSSRSVYIMPVISLALGVQISGGSGTQIDPYVIDTSH